MPSTSPSPLIGVFDSGVGGLSVLRALHRLRPESPLLYVADSGHAPYGDRDAAHVIDRSLRLTDHLVRQGAVMIVVACNTATAWAIDALRERHPHLPLVGVEPGVKPAAARSRSGHIAVLATPGTLASQRFQRLVDRHAAASEVWRVPCPGLAAAIEQGEAGRERVKALLDDVCAPLRGSEVDTVVLGCTHYPFVADEIAARLDEGVGLIDTADAVAQQIRRLGGWGAPPPHAEPGAEVRLQTTGDPLVLERLARSGLGLQTPAEVIAL